MRDSKEYHFLIALRLFSLVVAVISCGLGIRLGWDAAHPQYGLAALLLMGGIFSQAGINLINDIEDLHQADPGLVCAVAKNRINQNKRYGWMAFGVAALIGLYLVLLRGWPLGVVLLASAGLALNYNAGPLNFKHRGLAIIQVFVLMGLVMVEASYYVMTSQYSTQVLWLAVPVSLMISLLLLSNEIRDYESDLEDGVYTLTARIGLARAQKFYWLLILGTILAMLLFSALSWLSYPWLLILPLLMLPLLGKHLYQEDRRKLTPLSGQYFFLLGGVYLIMVQPVLVR